MPETKVEEGRQSWRQRLGPSMQAVLAGLVLFVVAFPLLWWNESRAVRSARAFGEGTSEVVSVAAGEADPRHEGRLVHVTGVATTGELIRDPQFGLSVRALRLRRTVEMYQWREEARSDERTASSGESERIHPTITSRVWSERLIDSSGFTSPLEHRNPTSMPVQSEERVVGRATIGAFTLSSELILRIDRFEPVQPETVPAGAPHGLRLDGGGFFLGADPARPDVGDLRVRFAAVRPVEVSVVARQARGRLEPYRTAEGRHLEMVEVGVHGAAEMFAAAQSRNRLATWLLRLAGAALLFVGIATALRPLAALVEVLPGLVPPLRMGLGLLAGVSAVALTLVTAAAAWGAYRPPVAAGLLAGAAVVLAVGRWAGRRR